MEEIIPNFRIKLRTVVIFALFVGTFCVNAQESKRETEDCAGLNQLARNIEAFGNSSSMTVSCKVFSNCSGLHCLGTVVKSLFNVSIGIQHCQDPVQLWVYLKAPKLNIDESRALINGTRIDLLPNPVLLLQKVYVVPKLLRKNGIITIGGKVCFTVLRTQCQEMSDVTVPVSKKMCSMDAGKSTRAPPTAKLTTGKIRTRATGTTQKPTAKKFTIVTRMTSEKPRGRHSGGGAQTGKMLTNMPGTAAAVSKVPHPTGTSHMQAHNGSKAYSGLSNGAKVALITSLVLLATLVLGIIVYWRKVKHRRPAYYNDIRVNMEDEDPFLDSQLVL